MVKTPQKITNGYGVAKYNGIISQLVLVGRIDCGKAAALHYLEDMGALGCGVQGAWPIPWVRGLYCWQRDAGSGILSEETLKVLLNGAG